MSDSVSNGRDGSGRFASGNGFGRGNPHLSRLQAAQSELREAVKPGDVARVLAKLHELALAGDAVAARAWLDRVLGRIPEAPTVAPLALPPLNDAASIAEAARAIVAAVAAGELDVANAVSIAALVRHAADATAWADLAARVEELERMRGARA